MPSRYYKCILATFVFVLAFGVSFGLYSKFTPKQSSPASAISVQALPLQVSTTSPPTQPLRSTASSGVPALSPGSTALSKNSVPLTTPTPSNYVTATFNVASTSYQLSVPPSSTLETGMAMLAAQSPQQFAFTQKEFPGLGEFVESINGVPNTDHDFWFLYVNGKESSTGISTTIVHSGDVIEWRYVHEPHF